MKYRNQDINFELNLTNLDPNTVVLIQDAVNAGKSFALINKNGKEIYFNSKILASVHGQVLMTFPDMEAFLTNLSMSLMRFRTFELLKVADDDFYHLVHQKQISNG